MQGSRESENAGPPLCTGTGTTGAEVRWCRPHPAASEEPNKFDSLGAPAARNFDGDYDSSASLGTYELRVGALLGQVSDAQGGAEGAALAPSRTARGI